MLNITRRDIEEAQSYARDAMRSPGSYKSSAENPFVRGATVLGGAALVGVATGYMGPIRIGSSPVPIDLAAGVGLLLVSLFGKSLIGEGGACHAQNLALGALAGYGTKFGVGIGTSLRAKAGKPALNLADISGEGDGRQDGLHGHRTPRQMQEARNKGPLSVSELAAMAQAVR